MALQSLTKVYKAIRRLEACSWLARTRMKVIIVGLDHNMQRRHPEEPSELSQTRNRFLTGLERLIRAQGIQLVAEEAGDDGEVAERLQHEADALYSFAGLSAPRIPVQETVARKTVREKGLCEWRDVRPPGPKESDEEYERQMFERVMAGAGSDQKVLVLCGENHRQGLARRFAENGCQIEDHPFEWLAGANR